MTTQGTSALSAEASRYRPVSYLQVTPGGGPLRVRLIAAPEPAIAEIVYIPGENICIPLTESQLELLKASEARLNEAARHLVEAKASGDRKAILQAQAQVRETLRREAEPYAEPREQAQDLPPLVKGDRPQYVELVRFAEKEFTLAPAHLIDQFRRRANGRPNTFPMDDRNAQGLSRSAPSGHAVDRSDPMSQWRADETGRLNGKKFRERFANVTASISEERELVQASGQIPSRYLVNPAVAALFRDELEALDKWIAKFNEIAKWSYGQREKQRDELIQLLEREEFTEDDWGRVKTYILDIWGEGTDEHGEFAHHIVHGAYPTTLNERKKLADDIRRQRLPPSRFEAEAGAQMMRYSAGVNGKFEANFSPGSPFKIAAEGKAELDLALIEGKASGTFYLPHNQGAQMEFTTRIKREHIEFIECENSLAFTSPQSPPHFAVNSCLVTPGAFRNMCEVLRQLNIVRNANPRGVALLRVIGHTSLTGSEDYNLKLSQRRAAAAYAALAQKADIWLNFFEQRVWGESEVRFLGLCIALHLNQWQTLVNWDQVDDLRELERQLDRYTANSEWLQRLRTPDMRAFVREIQNYYPRLALPDKRPNSGIIMPSEPEWRPNTRQGVLTLYWLIRGYFTLLRQSVSSLIEQDRHNFFEDVLFHELPYAGLGERFPIEPTQKESRRNRRVEFAVFRIDESKTRTLYEPHRINLGHCRIKFTGSVSFWAGANLSLAGHVEFQPTRAGKTESSEPTPPDRLAVVGRIKDNEYKDVVGGTASLFAGAKAELGLKAELDWAPPPEESASGNDSEDKSGAIAVPEFKTLGSIGYTVSGMLGVGFDGDIKIGFDPESKRFVIRLKAKAALGPGYGGSLDFQVGIRDMGEFIVVVWRKLAEVDFSWIDIFETEEDASGINVFELFSAFSWKLLKTGNVPGAMAAFSSGAALEISAALLKQARNLVHHWMDNKRKIYQANTLIDSIYSRPHLLRHLTPETKSRILFEMAITSRSIGDLANDIINLDFNHRREEAAVILIEMGITSIHDWQETLEHICQKAEDGRRLPYVEPGANAETKALRALDNLKFLRETLLTDEDDWQRVQNHLRKLSAR